jgi:hypothetical protein
MRAGLSCAPARAAKSHRPKTRFGARKKITPHIGIFGAREIARGKARAKRAHPTAALKLHLRHRYHRSRACATKSDNQTTRKLHLCRPRCHPCDQRATGGSSTQIRDSRLCQATPPPRAALGDAIRRGGSTPHRRPRFHRGRSSDERQKHARQVFDVLLA